ncbi:MAG TPA: anthranilate synthase family protein [Mycobacteriales bacterium]|nr:anthranilate synthase family protein [Mycobacteriales bacterium]
MLSFDRPYCLLHRDGTTHYASGRVRTVWWLAEVPRPAAPDGLPVLSMVPYSQLRERGFAVHDGGEPIITMATAEYREVSLDEILTGDPEPVVRLAAEPTFDVTDEQYAEWVRRIVAEEICQGEGSNFLPSRRSRLRIADFSAAVANVIFARLARSELGAYLTFCFHDGERFFIGASPERHITVERGVVTMNPICGTLPKSALTRRADLVEFLSDPKEINELFQVVDEELKMMSQICAEGGTIHGPYLKEMGSVIHTEYELSGRTTMDPVDAFRESMFAATMIGSPLQNAARIIHKYEADSRRYYSSALLVMGRDKGGAEHLDSAITIRTMEVGPDGEATIQTGASIVRDSDPEKECQEVRAKAGGLLRALSSGEPATVMLPGYVDQLVTDVLESRNKYLSRFWTERQDRPAVKSEFDGTSITIIDNEDQFTYMLRHVLDHLGLTSTVRRWHDPELDSDLAGADLVLVGPGPGNPLNLADAKMARVHGVVADLLAGRRKFLAVCLGHQILCHQLGMRIVRIDPPLQGVQQSIDLFGRDEPVGFYNTFVATRPAAVPAGVELAAAPDGGVMATRSGHFASFQFHVESVLTTNCAAILREALTWLLR